MNFQVPAWRLLWPQSVLACQVPVGGPVGRASVTVPTEANKREKARVAICWEIAGDGRERVNHCSGSMEKAPCTTYRCRPEVFIG